MTADPRLAALLDQLADARRELAAAVELVPPALRERAPAEARWSVAQIIEHLAMVESRAAIAVEQRVAGAPARADVDGGEARDAPAFDDGPLLDRTRRVTAPEPLQPPAATNAAAAWARLGAARETFEAAVRAADGRALAAVTLRHPAFGPLDGYAWIASNAGHERRHAAQVREVAAALADAAAG